MELVFIHGTAYPITKHCSHADLTKIAEIKLEHMVAYAIHLQHRCNEYQSQHKTLLDKIKEREKENSLAFEILRTTNEKNISSVQLIRESEIEKLKKTICEKTGMISKFNGRLERIEQELKLSRRKNKSLKKKSNLLKKKLAVRSAKTKENLDFQMSKADYEVTIKQLESKLKEVTLKSEISLSTIVNLRSIVKRKQKSPSKVSRVTTELLHALNHRYKVSQRQLRELLYQVTVVPSKGLRDTWPYDNYDATSLDNQRTRSIFDVCVAHLTETKEYNYSVSDIQRQMKLYVLDK